MGRSFLRAGVGVRQTFTVSPIPVTTSVFTFASLNICRAERRIHSSNP